MVASEQPAGAGPRRGGGSDPAAGRDPKDEVAGHAASVVEAAMVELVRRRGGEELTVGVALGATAALRDAADRKLFELVGYAREAGASWAEIGAALGVSTQAAHQRYGRGLPARLARLPAPDG
jgi:uncharacterized protein with PIN domain